jgi:PKD repeat protein
LDLDNDAAFSTGELIWSALNTTNPSGSVLIPNATIFNTAVRLRVTADVIGEIAGPCDQPLFGQAEDYSVIITPNNDPPVAAFTASPTQTCDGIVQFTDLSTDLPTGWSWDFGDGNTSTDPDPLHTYALPGIFTVTLTVTNANGSDASTQSALITYYANNVCDTTIMPGFQDELITDCNGTLTDDGGASADYTPGMSGAVTIAPPGAEVVTLTFTEFAFETDFDYLNIYDGPDNNAPLLYAITGNGVGAVPNGGVITSSGPAITIQQDASPGPTTWEGFICSWECSFTGVSENGPGPVLNVYPQPAGNEVTIALDGVLRNDLAIELHDALGRTAVGVRPSAGSGSITLDVSGLSGGLYTLTAITAEGRWSRTLVIE